MPRKPFEGEKKSHHQHLLITPSEVDAIDEWMFANKIRSRADAMRKLCQMGIVADQLVRPMVRNGGLLAPQYLKTDATHRRLPPREGELRQFEEAANLALKEFSDIALEQIRLTLNLARALSALKGRSDLLEGMVAAQASKLARLGVDEAPAEVQEMVLETFKANLTTRIEKREAGFQWTVVLLGIDYMGGIEATLQAAEEAAASFIEKTTLSIIQAMN